MLDRKRFVHGTRLLSCILTAVGLFFLLDEVLNQTRMALLPKNFSVVRANILYRSGQLRPEQLETVVRAHGIRTIVCLNPTDQPAERALAQRLGLGYEEHAMPGSGLGEHAMFHRFLETVHDPEKRPVLVHCAAGAYRTGVAVATYRMFHEGWSLDDAINEMRYSGCAIDGDQPLIDHVMTTFQTIPETIRALRHERIETGSTSSTAPVSVQPVSF